MSRSETTTNTNAFRAKRKDCDLQGRSLRFTPLRSQVIRPNAVTRDDRNDLALSRLVPAPPLQT